MAGINLESLVRRGVSVLSDAVACNLRLGTGYTAPEQVPASRRFMRHPSLDWAPGFDKPDGQRPQQADQNRMFGSANGAGRSRSRGGVLRRRAAMAGAKAMAANSFGHCATEWLATMTQPVAASKRGIAIR
jgi:hypothetical protein